MKKYITITQKTESEKWWDKIPVRDISMSLIGAGLTLVITMIANHSNNNEQFQKERREHTEAFVDNYFKDMNERFSLSLKLIDEESFEKKNHALIQEYTNKIENDRLKMEINANFDSLQFHRFFQDRFYPTLKNLNEDLNNYFQYAEGADKFSDGIKSLRSQIPPFLKRIKDIEQQVFKSMDANGVNE